MYTKIIKGKPYYYTTVRESTTKTKTIYLGSNKSLARKKDRELKGIPNTFSFNDLYSFRSSVYLLLIIFCGLTILIGGQITGFYTFSSDTVVFEVNESWNMSQAFVRVSMGTYIEDIPAEELIEVNEIIFHPEKYNFTEGVIYIDLMVSGELIETKTIKC